MLSKLHLFVYAVHLQSFSCEHICFFEQCIQAYADHALQPYLSWHGLSDALLPLDLSNLHLQERDWQLIYQWMLGFAVALSLVIVPHSCARLFDTVKRFLLTNAAAPEDEQPQQQQGPLAVFAQEGHPQDPPFVLNNPQPPPVPADGGDDGGMNENDDVLKQLFEYSFSIPLVFLLYVSRGSLISPL